MPAKQVEWHRPTELHSRTARHDGAIEGEQQQEQCRIAMGGCKREASGDGKSESENHSFADHRLDNIIAMEKRHSDG